MARRSFRLATPALLLASLVLVACDPDTGGGPHQPPPDDFFEEETALETQTVTFGPSGGTLTFADGSTLEVPPYALDADTEIHASRWEVPNASTDLIEYRLEPAGIVFARPATLRLALPSGAVSPEGLAVGFSPETVLDLMSLGRIQDDQRVAAQIVETGHAAVIGESSLRSVVGVAISTQLLRDGGIKHASESFIEGSLLLITRKEDGTVQEKRAELQPSGTFRFDGVPTGSYELRGLRRHPFSDRVNTFALYAEASTVDLGETTAIRPTAKRPTSPSPLSVVLENPEAPAESDDFTFVSVETNRFDYARWTDPDAPGPLFQTDAQSMVPARLLDAREGDVLTVVRAVAQSSSTGVAYLAAKDRAHLRTVVQEDEAETIVVAKLQPYEFNRSISTTIRVEDFVKSANVSGASDCVITVAQGGVSTATGPVGRGLTDSAHYDYSAVTFDIDREAATQAAGLMRYGSDRPTSEADYFSLVMGGSKLHLLPGTTFPSSTACLLLDLRLSLEAAQAGPIEPRLTPPSNLRVNSEAAGAGYLAIQPGKLVLEWDAPELGTARSYQVQLRTYRAEGEQTRSVGAFEFMTAERRLELAPELLQDAEAFSFMVTATDSSATAPFRFSILGATAGLGSGLVHVVD